MEIVHSSIAGLTALGIVGMIVWGINSWSVQETALREACIRSGGSVVVNGDRGSHCIRGGTLAAAP